jgi:hypothetical protein
MKTKYPRTNNPHRPTASSIGGDYPRACSIVFTSYKYSWPEKLFQNRKKVLSTDFKRGAGEEGACNWGVSIHVGHEISRARGRRAETHVDLASNSVRQQACFLTLLLTSTYIHNAYYV